MYDIYSVVQGVDRRVYRQILPRRRRRWLGVVALGDRAGGRKRGRAARLLARHRRDVPAANGSTCVAADFARRKRRACRVDVAADSAGRVSNAIDPDDSGNRRQTDLIARNESLASGNSRQRKH